MDGNTMKRVVIESPYKGTNLIERRRNKAYLILCMKDSLDRDEAPFASHMLYTSVLTNENNLIDRNKGIMAGFLWGEMAEAVIVYTDFGVTTGMWQGILHYRDEKGLPIHYRKLSLSVLRNMVC